MQTINTYYEDYLSLKNYVIDNNDVLLAGSNRAVLVQVFAGICEKNYLVAISKQIKELIPGAQVIGTTTNGEIMNGLVSGLKTVLSFSVFRYSDIKVAFAEITDGNEYELGESIATLLNSYRAKVLILFATGPTLNASQLLKGVEFVNAGLPVAGGRAGDNFMNKQCFVFCNEDVTDSGVVGAVIESDDLTVTCQSHLGWQPIGKEMTVTRAEGSRVYTIDNMPAFQIYRRYLGLDENTDIYNVVEFPLFICQNGLESARSPYIRYDDDSLGFLGEVAKGERIRLSFGHVGIIKEKTDAMLQTIRQQPVESIFVYSCASRRSFLQESAQIETLPLQDMAPTAGFFTNGEFFHADNCNQLLNTTMTTLALSESSATKEVLLYEAEAAACFNEALGEVTFIKDNVSDKSIEILKALTHLINTVSNELQEERNFNAALLNTAGGLIVVCDQEGRIVLFNQICEQTTGFSFDEVKNRYTWDIIQRAPEDTEYIKALFDKQKSDWNSDIKHKFENCWVTKDGDRRFISWTITYLFDETGTGTHAIGTGIDITDQRIMEERLRQSEAKLRSIYENADGIIFTLSNEGKLTFVSHGWTKILGHDISEVEGQLFEIFVHPYDVSKCKNYFRKAVNTGESTKGIEFRARHKDGNWRWFRCSSAQVMDESGHRLYSVGIADDITERKQAEEEIRYLSYHDKLTGLYNRTFFEEELKRINTIRQLPIGLIIGDVNGLKLINDALGHQEGDKVLIKVAEILRDSCRQEDIISRWGGDEFIILLPRCDSAATLRVFKRIYNSFEGLNELAIPINISLGMAIQNSLDQDINDVIREAEEKMYRNKLLESRSTRSSFIKSLEKTLWEKSHETKDHCQRLQEMAQKMGRSLELTDSELDNLKLLAALHDIGKIAVPNHILDKPGKLLPEEWETIKSHPEIGYRIALSSPELAPIAEAILHHHESWDGSGYPLGLKGEKIPLISRIIAITDTYDVMINGRPYKKAVTKEDALAEIERCAGTQFDPELVRKGLFFD